MNSGNIPTGNLGITSKKHRKDRETALWAKKGFIQSRLLLYKLSALSVLSASSASSALSALSALSGVVKFSQNCEIWSKL